MWTTPRTKLSVGMALLVALCAVATPTICAGLCSWLRRAQAILLQEDQPTTCLGLRPHFELIVLASLVVVGQVAILSGALDQLLRRVSARGSQQPSTDNAQGATEALLRARARAARRSASAFLAILCAVIVTMVLIYLYAPHSTTRAETFRQLVGRVSSSASRMDEDRARVHEVLMVAQSEHNELVRASEGLQDGTFKKTLNNFMSRTKRAVTHGAVSGGSSSTRDYLQGQDPLQRAKWAGNDLKQLAIEIAKKSEGDKQRDLISELAARVGAIVMLVFLAGFLTNAYRYLTRLGAAYDARADALSMTNWADTLPAAKAFASVDEVAFDKAPVPTADVVEAVKAMRA